MSRRVGALAAEDLLADVFEAAFKARLRVVAARQRLSAAVLVRHCRQRRPNHPRRRPRPGWTGRDDPMDWDAADARLDAQIRRAQLASALSELSSANANSCS